MSDEPRRGREPESEPTSADGPETRDRMEPGPGDNIAYVEVSLDRRFGDSEPEARAEPFGSWAAFRAWCRAAVRALVDVQLRTDATRTLLPLAYLLGLVFALGSPLVLIVALWQVSAVLGAIAIVVAIPLALSIAAAVRLALEFLVNASRLATRVEHINSLADDLFQALSEASVPLNQLSEDVRAVQFWRFRKRK